MVWGLMGPKPVVSGKGPRYLKTIDTKPKSDNARNVSSLAPCDASRENLASWPA